MDNTKDFTNMWKWDRNSFINISNVFGNTEAVYDAVSVTDTVSQSGKINNINIKSNNDKISVSGQYVQYFSDKNIVQPDSTIGIILSSTTYSILDKINPKYPIRILSYKYENDNISRVNIEYKYSPGDLFDSNGYKFKLENINNTYSIVLNNLYTSSHSNTIVKKQTSFNGYNVFLVPSFPINTITINTSLSDSTIDKYRGIIYTTDNVSELDISYTDLPMLLYVPHGQTTEYTTISNILKNNFISLTYKPEYYV